MKVQYIEFSCSPADVFEHGEDGGALVADRGIQSQRLGTARHQLGTGHRVAAGEQRDLVSLPNQLLGKVRHDPLSATIQLGRHSLGKRGYLRNSHHDISAPGPDSGGAAVANTT